MSGQQNKNRNFQKVMKKLEFDFPGFNTLPRSPGTYRNLDVVDIHIAKKKLQLLHRIPVFDPKFARTHGSGDDFNRRFMPELIATGYSSVAIEIQELLQEEQLILTKVIKSNRTKSFLDDKGLFEHLVKGLISCCDAEKSGNIQETVAIRKGIGEHMITLSDCWLARKMFTKCLDHLQYVDDESDKMKAEIYCLLSYVCIYFEESQETGFDLPTKCLSEARSLCKDKRWAMKKTVMNLLIPKAINVYGLKNEWITLKSNWINLYELSTILLHILCVKKARYWQNELFKENCLEESRTELNVNPEEAEDETKKMKSQIFNNIVDSLTSALGYADKVRQMPAFLATTLRRGLFYEEYNQNKNAEEDFNALHALSKSFDDRESLAMTMNRFGHQQIRNKNTCGALDYYAQQLEISRDNNFPELMADALLDIGAILLEEGHTWEADECCSNAFTLFHETKVPDTPNDLDELSWAMMGVSRGHHLWGRYSALIRTQEKSYVKSIFQWKCTRKPLPLVKMKERMYEPQERSEFDEQYMKNKGKERRRLFEFPSEIQSKKSVWFQSHGFHNVFSYINVSDKQHVSPIFSTDLLSDNYQYKYEDLSIKGRHKKRKMQAMDRTASIQRSFKQSLGLSRLSVVSKLIAENPYFEQNHVKPFASRRSATEVESSTKVEESITSFLNDADAALKSNTENDSSTGKEEEDVSEDSEVKSKRKSVIFKRL